jgi:hypothetical protein
VSERRILKTVHITSTVWFALSAGYIFVSALRQAGFKWWVIFSLSGYSALVVFLLISLYLFAIFRGVSRSQKIAIEHPLTTSIYYLVLYDISPFLGALAGCIGMIGENRISQFMLGVALGTFWTTFLFWVIIDPVTGLLEMLLPTSRKYHVERLAQAKTQRDKRKKDRERLVAEILMREELELRRWQKVLEPNAEKLAGLLTTDIIDVKEAEREAVDVGVSAWQLGGLSCMRQLHSMTMQICRKKYQDSMIVDCISTWWDGIGSWRSPSLG